MFKFSICCSTHTYRTYLGQGFIWWRWGGLCVKALCRAVCSLVAAPLRGSATWAFQGPYIHLHCTHITGRCLSLFAPPSDPLPYDSSLVHSLRLNGCSSRSSQYAQHCTSTSSSSFYILSILSLCPYWVRPVLLVRQNEQLQILEILMPPPVRAHITCILCDRCVWGQHSLNKNQICI